MTTLIFSTIGQAQQYAEDLELQYEKHLGCIVCYDDTGEISHCLKFKRKEKKLSLSELSQL